METMIDGTPFNPANTCRICPEKPTVRLTDGERRSDLCLGHAKQTKKVYKEKVDIIAVWGGTTMEDMEYE